jgi:hypothetical protein
MILLPENELDLAVILIVSSTSAALVLLAVWTALANWPAWYVRVGGMCAALAALFPIEAYEPAALFLLVMPLVALAMRLFYRSSRPLAHVPDEPAAQRKWMSFTLRDLLFALTFFAVASAMCAVLWRKQAFAEWRSLLITATALAAVAVFSAGVVVSRKRRWLQWLGLLPSLAAIVAWHRHDWYSWSGLGSILWNHNYHIVHGNLAVDRVLHCLLADGLFALCIAASLALTRLARRPSRHEAWHRLATMAARGILIVGGVMFAAPSLVVYWWMLHAPPLPESNFPRENSLPRVIALMNEAHSLNTSESSVVESAEAVDSAPAGKLARIYSEMQAALGTMGYVDFDLTRDGRYGYPPKEQGNRI